MKNILDGDKSISLKDEENQTSEQNNDFLSEIKILTIKIFFENNFEENNEGSELKVENETDNT